MKFRLLLGALTFCGCVGQPAAAAPFNHRPAMREAQEMLEADQLPEVAVRAYDAMFHVAAHELADHGHEGVANMLTLQWTTHYRDVLLHGELEDVGDHVPFSQWVSKWYAALEGLLGVQLMEMTHLRDIWVLNFTLPVVMDRQASSQWCQEDLALHPTDTCKAEYRRHFAGTKYAGLDPFGNPQLHHGFAGVVTYWLIWAACEGATWGGGWFVICTPAGDLGEFVTEKWVAPKVSNSLYDRANQ